MENTALIVVDYQKCFVEGGSLGVGGGLGLAPVINEIMQDAKRRSHLIIATRDWHPASSVHFDRWPVHAVGGALDSEYAPGLETSLIDVEILKGYKNSDDGYSGFEGVTALDGNAIDGFSPSLNSKTLEEVLRSHQVRAIEIVGLALDFCVADTARQ